MQRKFFELDNYEIFIPEQYSKNHTIPLFLVDDPRHVAFVKESFVEELDRITRKDVQEQNSYEQMQRAMASGPGDETDLVCVNLKFLNLSERETIAAGNIRTLLCSGSYENAVAVYGSGHTLRDTYGFTLF